MAMSNKIAEGVKILAEAESYHHGFLPLAASYCRCLGIVDIVDGMVNSRMKVSP